MIGFRRKVTCNRSTFFPASSSQYCQSRNCKRSAADDRQCKAGLLHGGSFIRKYSIILPSLYDIIFQLLKFNLRLGDQFLQEFFNYYQHRAQRSVNEGDRHHCCSAKMPATKLPERKQLRASSMARNSTVLPARPPAFSKPLHRVSTLLALTSRSRLSTLSRQSRNTAGKMRSSILPRMNAQPCAAALVRSGNSARTAARARQESRLRVAMLCRMGRKTTFSARSSSPAPSRYSGSATASSPANLRYSGHFSAISRQRPTSSAAERYCCRFLSSSASARAWRAAARASGSAWLARERWATLSVISRKGSEEVAWFWVRIWAARLRAWRASAFLAQCRWMSAREQQASASLMWLPPSSFSWFLSAFLEQLTARFSSSRKRRQQRAKMSNSSASTGWHSPSHRFTCSTTASFSRSASAMRPAFSSHFTAVSCTSYPCRLGGAAAAKRQRCGASAGESQCVRQSTTRRSVPSSAQCAYSESRFCRLRIDRTCSQDSKERSCSRAFSDWQCSVKPRSNARECSSKPANCARWKRLLARKKGSARVRPCRRKRPWCCSACSRKPTLSPSRPTEHLKLVCACRNTCRQRLSLSGPMPSSRLSHPTTCPAWYSRAASALVAPRLSALSCRSYRRKLFAARATTSASSTAFSHCSFAWSSSSPKYRMFSPDWCISADSSSEFDSGRSRLSISSTSVAARSGMDLAISVSRLMASRVSLGTFTLLSTALRSPPSSMRSSYSSSCSSSGRRRFRLLPARAKPWKSCGRKWLMLVRKHTSYLRYLFSERLSFSQNFWSAATTLRFSSSSNRLREILVSRSNCAMSCCSAAESAEQSVDEWTEACASMVKPLYSMSIISGTRNLPRLRVICRMQLAFLNCCRSCLARSLPTTVLRSWKEETSLSSSSPISSESPPTSYRNCPSPSAVGLQCRRRSSSASSSTTTRTISSAYALNRSTTTYSLSPFRNSQSQLQSRIFLSLRPRPDTPLAPSASPPSNGSLSPSALRLSSSFFFRRYSSRRSAGPPLPFTARFNTSGCRGSSRPKGSPEPRLLPCSVQLSWCCSGMGSSPFLPGEFMLEQYCCGFCPFGCMPCCGLEYWFWGQSED